MIDVLKKGFIVMKQYSGFSAQLLYSTGTDQFILKVESPNNKITDTVVQRALLDFNISLLSDQILLDKKRQYVVQSN